MFELVLHLNNWSCFLVMEELLMMTTFLNFSSANQFVMNLNTFTKCGCKLHYPLQNINKRKACLNYGKKQMRLDNLPSLEDHCREKKKSRGGIFLLPESAFMLWYDSVRTVPAQTEKLKGSWHQSKSMQIKKHLNCQREICLARELTKMKSQNWACQVFFRITAHR